MLGLVTRKERWSLSARGWLLMLLFWTTAVFVVARTVQPFLAITARASADLLVVEGWVSDGAIRAAHSEFSTGIYRLALTTGEAPTRTGLYFGQPFTGAEITAERLRLAGLPADRVQSAPHHWTSRDRTYASAVALRTWLQQHRVPVRAINIVTDDVHARRTRLLFQAAFGPRVAIGIIAVPPSEYDGARWWCTSAGVRAVVGEAIAYLYARFLFAPPAPLTPSAISS